MPENKTRATDASVSEYLASRANDEQQADCAVLMKMFGRLTGEPPRMWGPSIVGYGSYHYTYDSGRTGESCLAAFAIRGRELVVYLSCDGGDQQALLARVGKHKMGKSCFYFKRLADLDVAVLEQLVTEVKAKYG
jgi:hypothetical protein